tara:strand:- start:805 stop:2070 length:1266 start_codon:yes stop_codon:yes gene_type:complete
MPLVVKGFPILIIITACIGIVYFFRAYQRLGKPKKDYYFLPYNLLRDGLLKIIKERNAMFFMVILFFVYCISLLFSEDIENAGGKIILKSCYIYFPLIFSLTKWDKDKLIRVIDFFLVGCVLQVFISYIDAYFQSGWKYNPAEFYYTKLSFNLHPSYAAFFISIGFILNCARIIQLIKMKQRAFYIFIRLIFLIAFAVYIVMLSSKSGLLSLTISVITMLFYAFYCFKSRRMILIGSFCVVLLVGSGVFLFGERAAIKFSEMGRSLKNKNSIRNKSAKMSSSATRLVLWENSLIAIENSNYMGYGLGDGKQKLQDQLAKNGEEFVLYKNYNSHNQFLETTLSIGLIGLILLLLIISLGTFRFVGEFTTVYILLGVIIIVNLSVESMMEKQAGSIAIVWLLCLLVSAKDSFKTVFNFKSGLR